MFILVFVVHAYQGTQEKWYDDTAICLWISRLACRDALGDGYCLMIVWCECSDRGKEYLQLFAYGSLM